jgi:hypothetical protein
MHVLWCHELHVDLDLFDGSSMVADLATNGFTLMRAGLEYVDGVHEADHPEQAAENARR